MHWLYFFVLVVGAYLVGAIPNGLLVSLLFGKNPLQAGSGKTGTSNTLSTAGPVAAGIVLLLDLLKGAVVVLAARLIEWPDDAWQGMAMGATAAAAIVGHNWSVWVRLYSGKWGGGRGIITALGAMLLVNSWVVLVAVIVGAAALLLTRYVALAAIAGTIAALIAIIALGAMNMLSFWLLPGAVAWCLLVIVGFHDNIGRLLKGTETRL
ncbi:MAG: glycerol-3-phosphate acyltransferase [Chloroflexota bacterium]